MSCKQHRSLITFVHKNNNTSKHYMDQIHVQIMSYITKKNSLLTGRLLDCAEYIWIGFGGTEHPISGWADEVAKTALHSSVSAVKYPPSDLYHDVTALCYKLWQADWDQRTGNKLHSVKPHLEYYPLSSLSRRDTVVCEDCVSVIRDFLTRIFSLEKISPFALHVVVFLPLFTYSLNVRFTPL